MSEFIEYKLEQARERLAKNQFAVTEPLLKREVEEYEKVLEALQKPGTESFVIKDDFDEEGFEKSLVPENVKKAAYALRVSFSWKYSPEGYKYWNNVFNRLCELGDRTIEPDEEAWEHDFSENMFNGVQNPTYKEKEFLNGVNLDGLQTAIDSIDDMFLWSDSPQGGVFWAELSGVLSNIRGKVKKLKG